jgi:hypothetical protein
VSLGHNIVYAEKKKLNKKFSAKAQDSKYIYYYSSNTCPIHSRTIVTTMTKT